MIPRHPDKGGTYSVLSPNALPVTLLEATWRSRKSGSEFCHTDDIEA
jgi:hypothetical protein